MFLCAKTASAATAALGVAGYLLHQLGRSDPTMRTVLGLVVLVVLTVVVAGGMQRSNRTNAAIVSMTLLSLLAFVAVGACALLSGTGVEGRLGDDLANKLGSADATSVLHATALMFVAYTGYGRIATLGEEVKEPRRSIPRAIIATLVVSAGLKRPASGYAAPPMSDSRVTDEAELRELYGDPLQRALDKAVPELTDAHRRFIERSPFLVLGSHGPSGADVSPRGDQPGFVKIIDPRTLAIPDRVGNRRIDTLTNVLTNPGVALIFFVPGVNETLRVSGHAHITIDPDLLAELAHEGRRPTTALVVEVTEAFHQCVRALRRAGLWNPEDFAGAEFPRISSTPESSYDGKLY